MQALKSHGKGPCMLFSTSQLSVGFPECRRTAPWHHAFVILMHNVPSNVMKSSIRLQLAGPVRRASNKQILR